MYCLNLGNRWKEETRSSARDMEKDSGWELKGAVSPIFSCVTLNICSDMSDKLKIVIIFIFKTMSFKTTPFPCV